MPTTSSDCGSAWPPLWVPAVVLQLLVNRVGSCSVGISASSGIIVTNGRMIRGWRQLLVGHPSFRDEGRSVGNTRAVRQSSRVVASGQPRLRPPRSHPSRALDAHPRGALSRRPRGACRRLRPRAGREALLRYVLRPPVAQERVEQRPDGLVRITLKKAYTDGTIAVDLTRCRCCAGWPPVCPPTPPAHPPLRGRAGRGEPVEVASRAAIAPSRRRERQAG
jgi:hypothetical protein